MLCISPLNIPKPNGLGNKDRILVPCGVCVACLTSRRNDWTLRLKEELKNSLSGYFVTLTYSDENILYGSTHPTLYKKDVQLFIKRLREYGEKIRYYAVGEYGTKTLRPHYHLLIFNLNEPENIAKAWQIGHVKVSQINGKCIHYVTKYHVNKTNYPDGTEKPFALMSRRPGIGAAYINSHFDYHSGNPQKAFYTDLSGEKKRLPRFYKQKLYSKSDLTIIANENSRTTNTAEQNKELAFKNLNPTANYFLYTSQQKEELEKSYKQKINYKNTF